jgi:hypothetical protein
MWTKNVLNIESDLRDSSAMVYKMLILETMHLFAAKLHRYLDRGVHIGTLVMSL